MSTSLSGCLPGVLVLADQVNTGKEFIRVEMQVIVHIKVVLDLGQVLLGDLAVDLLCQYPNFFHGQLFVTVDVGLGKDLCGVVASVLVDCFFALIFALLFCIYVYWHDKENKRCQ